MPTLTQDQEEQLMSDVNDKYNATIKYQKGQAGWQLNNLPDGGDGDCDTYAATKGEALIKAGIDPKRIAIQTTKLPSGVDHAVLRVTKQDGSVTFLGNDIGSGGPTMTRDAPGNPTMIFPHNSWDLIRQHAKSQHPADNPDKLMMR